MTGGGIATAAAVAPLARQRGGVRHPLPPPGADDVEFGAVTVFPGIQLGRHHPHGGQVGREPAQAATSVSLRSVGWKTSSIRDWKRRAIRKASLRLG